MEYPSVKVYAPIRLVAGDYYENYVLPIDV